MPRAHFIVAFALLALCSRAGSAADPSPPSWTEIAEILDKRCTMCHSEKGAGRGLRLDSYDALLLGSERGPVLLSGDAGGSELIRRLRGESVPRMPFLSRPLPEDQIDLIVRWVDAGFPGPALTTEVVEAAAQERSE
jgi:hypothetical protein